MLPSVLRRDLTQQFGTKAPEKLQRLLCMLRENQDVFQIFTQNVIRFSFDAQSLELAEAIVHFMFLDLASPQLDRKLVFIIHEIMSRNHSAEMGKEEDLDFVKHEKKFKDELFTELTKSLDAK
jgi:hypothetical protein